MLIKKTFSRIAPGDEHLNDPRMNPFSADILPLVQGARLVAADSEEGTDKFNMAFDNGVTLSVEYVFIYEDLEDVVVDVTVDTSVFDDCPPNEGVRKLIDEMNPDRKDIAELKEQYDQKIHEINKNIDTMMALVRASIEPYGDAGKKWWEEIVHALKIEEEKNNES